MRRSPYGGTHDSLQLTDYEPSIGNNRKPSIPSRSVVDLSREDDDSDSVDPYHIQLLGEMDAAKYQRD